MKENVGGKIKILAKILAIALSTICLLVGIVLLATSFGNNDNIKLGLFVLIGGCGFVLVISWLIYGFGELIKKTTEMEEQLRIIKSKLVNDGKVETIEDKKNRLEKLHQQGLLTDEEYNLAISNLK